MHKEHSILATIRPALVVFVLLTLITGVAYPLGLVALAGALPAPAPEALIGQSFREPHFFWGRLSAAAPTPSTGSHSQALTGSSGSNLAPSNPQLVAAARTRIDALAEAARSVGLDTTHDARVPVDLVTASGSGLDPHLSIAGAQAQVARVARARGLTEAAVHELVRQAIIPRQFRVLGEPVVDIQALNRSLDRVAPQGRP